MAEIDPLSFSQPYPVEDSCVRDFSPDPSPTTEGGVCPYPAGAPRGARRRRGATAGGDRHPGWLTGCHGGEPRLVATGHTTSKPLWPTCPVPPPCLGADLQGPPCPTGLPGVHFHSPQLQVLRGDWRAPGPVAGLPPRQRGGCQEAGGDVRPCSGRWAADTCRAGALGVPGACFCRWAGRSGRVGGEGRVMSIRPGALPALSLIRPQLTAPHLHPPARGAPLNTAGGSPVSSACCSGDSRGLGGPSLPGGTKGLHCCRGSSGASWR